MLAAGPVLANCNLAGSAAREAVQLRRGQAKNSVWCDCGGPDRIKTEEIRVNDRARCYAMTDGRHATDRDPRHVPHEICIRASDRLSDKHGKSLFIGSVSVCLSISGCKTCR